jgi:hypothetical protein
MGQEINHIAGKFFCTLTLFDNFLSSRLQRLTTARNPEIALKKVLFPTRFCCMKKAIANFPVEVDLPSQLLFFAPPNFAKFPRPHQQRTVANKKKSSMNHRSEYFLRLSFPYKSI